MQITITLDIDDKVAAVLPQRVAAITEEEVRVIDGREFRGSKPRYSGSDPVMECLTDVVRRTITQQLAPEMFVAEADTAKVSKEYQEAIEAMRKQRAELLLKTTVKKG